MSELQDLINDINKLQSSLHKLINQEGINLQDPEVIAASQILNAAITKYNELINKKID